MIIVAVDLKATQIAIRSVAAVRPWEAEIRHKIAFGGRAARDLLVRQLSTGRPGQAKLYVAITKRKRRDTTGKRKKERRPPVGCHTHQHVVDFAVILGGANHALAQSALSFFHLVGVIVLLRAAHACYRITLEFF